MDATFQRFEESPERRKLLQLTLQKKGIVVQAPRIPKRHANGPCPLSYSQQRLWFIDQLGQQGGAAYHVPGALRLLGALDRVALREALDTIVRRHEVLRTRFLTVDGNPSQVISEKALFSLEEHDLSELDAADRDAEIRRAADSEASARFDLSAGPLIRGRLIRCAEREHVLLVVMHHIVSDGWSMAILTRELSALYAAFRDHKPAALPSLPIQYADYALWQREWLRGDALESQLEFWRQHLDGAPGQLELPTDRPRPMVQSHRGDRVDIELSGALSGALNTVARKHGTTLFVVLHTAFAILLSALSGQRDIVVGVPVANRQRTEVEPLIGFFVNTLALRTRLADDATVGSVIKQVKATTLAGYENQDVPFERVVEKINPLRTLSRSPVFQAMLVLQNTPRAELTLPGLALTPVSFVSSGERFDLTVSLHETKSGIVGIFSYASDLFDRCTVERWASSFEALLGAMAENPAQLIGRLPLMSATEQLLVTTGFNATRAEHSPTQLVHQLFERQTIRTPNAIAAIYADRELTYLELNRKANQLAHHLRKHSAGPDRPIAICLERGLDVAVAILAVLKSGSTYLPLDPAYPSARIEYMLKDSSPEIVLADRTTLPLLVPAKSAVILLDEASNVLAEESDQDASARDTGLTPEHLAYVIYTSGSTGQPKAVGLPHRALANLMHWHLTALPAASRVLQFAPLSFDVSFYEFFAAWGCGGAVAIASREMRYDPATLMGFLHAKVVDKAILPVTVLQQLAEQQERTPDRLIRLRNVIATGEQLRVTPAIRRFFAGLPECTLHNHYGPSETHVVTAFTLTGAPDEWPDHPSIGRPIANTRIYILNSGGRPVPIGVVGEMFIGGAGVARGYLKRPALTAERFVPDPFGDGPGGRMYRTGDLARWRADGTIEYLGRNDHQVKIRGFRIEPGEIEGCLSRHARIREAVVLASENSTGEKRLVAYFTGTDGVVSDDELRAHLRTTLPDYMVPASYVQLQVIPLTPNGKVDRAALQALPMPDRTNAAREAPVGEVERAVAAIWQDLLGVDVSRDDNFFDLGGHSMLTSSLIRRLQQVGFIVSLATVFKHPTLKSLAECLEMGIDQDVVPNPILLREGDGTPLFLVHEVSGDVLPYLPLARLLTRRMPVWGLQQLGIWRLESLEQLAAEHVEAIRRVQPTGPYRLAGWSLGAHIAYEMASQLVGADETVEFLGMIDAYAPLGTSRESMSDREVLDEFIRSRWSDPKVVRELTSLTDLERFLETCKAKKYLPSQLTLADMRRLLKNRRLIPEVARRYDPMTLPFKVHFFEAEAPLRPPLSRNWAPLIGNNMARQVIGGTHRTLMEPPHVQRLAEAMSEAIASAPIVEQSVPEYVPVCPIQRNSSARATIFCIPGAGASVACFLPLAEALGSSVNVYGLQPRGLDCALVPHSTVTAAAKRYVGAIRELHPVGPYRLLGHSFGGWVAFEVARQLRALGEDVATVVVLDSEAPRGDQRSYTRVELFMRLVEALELGRGCALGLSASALQGLDNAAQLKLLRDRMVSAGILPRDVPLDTVRGTMRVFGRNLQAVYLPTPALDTDIALFQAMLPSDTAREKEMIADAADWSTLTRASKVFRCPGNHMTMLGSPHVEFIAENVRRIWTEV